MCSSHALRADDGIRTRDPHLGKVMLYQLSHVRVALDFSSSPAIAHPDRPPSIAGRSAMPGMIRAGNGRSSTLYAGSSPCHHGTGLTFRFTSRVSSSMAPCMPWTTVSMSGTSSQHPWIPTYMVSR